MHQTPESRKGPYRTPGWEDVFRFVPVPGTSIKKATINRQGDNYEVSLGMETVIDQIHPVEEVSVSDILSADMGLKDFAVLGDKEGFLKIRNPRWIKIHERAPAPVPESLIQETV